MKKDIVCSAVGNGRLDLTEWHINRRVPLRFRSDKNDIYITKKTMIAAQFNRCKKLLDIKYDTVHIHALGHAISRALDLALLLRESMAHSIKLDIQTSSVQVDDEVQCLFDGDLADIRKRIVSAVHILITRI